MASCGRTKFYWYWARKKGRKYLEQFVICRLSLQLPAVGYCLLEVRGLSFSGHIDG